MKIFDRRVEKELEEKGIQPTEAVKKLEHSRQVLHVVIGVLTTLVLALGAGLLYFHNKNQPQATPTVVSSTKEETNQQAKTTESTVDMGADHLLKLSAKERADEATAAFKNWYTSFKNDTPILEINEELLTDPSGTSPYDLQEKLVKNMKDKFGTLLADSYYNSLRDALNANPLTIDPEKGLTWTYEGDDKNWLITWLFDTEKDKKNTKIVLRNDFPYEWVDWRNKGKEKFPNVFNNVDWENDINYEVVGVDLSSAKKNIASSKVIFIQIHYNNELSIWQITGNLGGGN
ncbi:hypothetical protein [Enterococcus faecium]|uniref:hypothetical protein n=1 Tax=Enterococcus faecium TaxID=1352 RepID=UPI0019EE88B4|nr:hypothetical protein [Enterococcus faecium]EME8274923.1 hypothetical protein [Enterococcus faecium]EMF0280670.1 hypothetical protein [Enterococcus faecium]EMF0346908.1 hypothetical protein [Enterococcus faecium]